MSMKNYRKVLSYLPHEMAVIFEKIPLHNAENINEIRLRVNRPLAVTVSGESFFVTENGAFTLSESLGVICTAENISDCFKAICEYSIHSYQKEISQGFITVEGGNRVGICGTAVITEKAETIKYVSGLNFRIAGQAIGCSENLCKRLFEKKPVSVLIVGEPLSGKTTFLRDICRILGKAHRVSIVDERSEIAACYHGIPQNDVGFFTDVLDGYNKKNGIETAIRVMSPEIVVCDEIGGRADCLAIAESVNSGVKFIASVHGKSIDEVLKREHIKKLADYGIFEYAVLLEERKVKEIKKIND